MKKSVLIAPVLGIMLVAAAGSVGGTVAWFSASSKWNTSVSEFKVARLDGNLDCEMEAGVRTTPSGDKKTATVDSGTAITHGSYDLSTGKIWVIEDTSAQDKTYLDKGTEADALTNVTTINDTYWGALDGTTLNPVGDSIFYAVSWHMNFTYEWGGTYTPQNLYFDATSTVTALDQKTSATPAGTNGNTWKGFRLAFICGANKFVWAPGQLAAECNHVVSSSAIATKGVGSGKAYNSGANDYNLIASDTVINQGVGEPATYSGVAGECVNVNDNTQAHFTDHTARIHPNYIGQMTGAKQSKSTALAVTCVVWFEGTDPNVVNEATLDTVSAALKFFSKPAQPAA